MARLVVSFIRRICARELVAQRTIKDDPRTALVNWSRDDVQGAGTHKSI